MSSNTKLKRQFTAIDLNHARVCDDCIFHNYSDLGARQLVAIS